MMNDDKSIHNLVDEPGRQLFVVVLLKYAATDLTLIKNKQQARMKVITSRRCLHGADYLNISVKMPAYPLGSLSPSFVFSAIYCTQNPTPRRGLAS